MSINPNLDGSPTPLGTPAGPGPVDQSSVDYEKSAHVELDPLLMSTLSPSQQEALMVLYMMNMPILAHPHQDGSTSLSIGSIGSVVAADISKVGADMWDRYLDYLQEQKERIKDELESPRYQKFLELKSPEFRDQAERGDPLATYNAVRGTDDYKVWFGGLPDAVQEDEIRRSSAINLWSITIDSVHDYIKQARIDDPSTIPFMAASFVIATTFIGDYMNIVDVVSTKMVAVNPIQDAVAHAIPMISPDFRETCALTINLFAVGLVNFATAEAIGNAQKTGEKPATRDGVLAFARNVYDKVSGNEVNSFLMAMLVNSSEKGEPVSDQRFAQLLATAKAIMVSVALAALYIVETGKMSPKEFAALVNGQLEPRSEEEKNLVSYMLQLKGSFSSDAWNHFVATLGDFFAGQKSADAFLNPMKIFVSVAQTLQTPEQQA